MGRRRDGRSRMSVGELYTGVDDKLMFTLTCINSLYLFLPLLQLRGPSSPGLPKEIISGRVREELQQLQEQGEHKVIALKVKVTRDRLRRLQMSLA